MNLVQVKLLPNPTTMMHNTSGHVRLSGAYTSKNYTFLNLVGAKPDDYVMVSVTNTITYGKVISIVRDATPEDIISEWLKPILCIISNKKVADYYSLRHHYRNNVIKKGKLFKVDYDQDAYRDALREIEQPSDLIDNWTNTHNKAVNDDQEARHQLYVEAAARKKIAQEQARLDWEQLQRLQDLLNEVNKSIVYMRSRGFTINTL